MTKEIKPVTMFCMPYETVEEKEKVLQEIHTKYDKEGYSFALEIIYNKVHGRMHKWVDVEIFSD